jgi:hypothetical protein
LKSSEDVHAVVDCTQLRVLSVAPLRVIPPPFAVVSVGEVTEPSSMFLSSTVSVVELIVVVVPLTVRSPATTRLVKVPTLVRLDVTTFDASVAPVRVVALAAFATACPPVHVNLLSIALIAALSVVPHPVSPLAGSGVTPSIKLATVFS